MADKNMEAQISVEFEEATSRQSLNSGETINTLWGKVKRWLSDLKVVCFSGSYNDLSDTPTTATKDTDGLMSAEDKSKLDGVATGANKTIVDTILSNTSTNPVQNKVVKQAIDSKADKTVATTSANGLMSAEDKVKLDNADDTYALKSKYGDTTINVGRKAGTIVGHFSTAEGQATTANSLCSHAEGDQTTASGNFSHSEGEQTKAIGVYSHAEGCGTEANGRASHAEGRETTAFGDYSHTSGYYTKALHDNEAAYGKYNESNDNTLFSIGDGTADDERHNAFEITTTGGKLHDKDIATTDLIPTTLPANGGRADYATGADYATNAGNANTATTATNAVNANTVGGITDGYYLGLFNNNDTKLSADMRLYGKYNGKTNDGRIFLTTTPNSENKIHEVAVTYAYDAALLNHRESGRIATQKTDGTYYNPINKHEYDAYIQWNGSHFMLKTYSGNATAVDYADTANTANSASNADAVNGVQVVCVNDATTANWLAAFTSANNLRAIDPARAYVGNAGNANMVRSQYLIGTSANCAYNTILAWANAQTGTAYASIVAGDGFPSDAPHQNEAMLKVESDYYGARKIVTWTRFMGGQPRLVMIRPIFGTNWNDDQWRT